jgi:toxin YoeB
MNFEFTETAWEEFEYWIETDPKTVEKIKELLKDINIPFMELENPNR